MAAQGDTLRNRIANLKKEAADRQRKAAIKARVASSLKSTPQPTPIEEKKASVSQPNRAHAASRNVSSQKKEAQQMATVTPRLSEERKAQIRARLAAKQAGANFQSIRTAAQVRVASAWTLAKVLLPSGETRDREKFASALLSLDTRILASTVRKAAKDAFNTKMAEELSDVHKVQLNDLMENESVLNSLKNELAKESKTGSAKKAEDDQKPTPDMAIGDRPADKGTGEQPATYSEPNSDGPKMPDGSAMPAPGAKEAARRSAGTVEDAKEFEKDPEAWRKKNPGKLDPPPSEIKMGARKKADEGEEGEEGAAPAEGGEVGDDMDLEMGDETEVTDDNVVEEVEALKERVQEAEASISQIEGEIAEVEGEEIDLGEVFNDDVTDDKRQSLADEGGEGEEGDEFLFGNEGDDKAASIEGELTEEEDFFGPTDTTDMTEMVEGGVDVEIADPADFFTPKASVNAADRLAGRKSNADRRASLLGDVVDPGEIADHFESELAGDDRNLETDHDDDILSEVFDRMDQDTFEQTEYHQEPEFEKAAAKSSASAASRRAATMDQKNVAARQKAAATVGAPKAAPRKVAGKKPVMTIDPAPVAKSAGSEREQIARLVFGDDDF